MWKAHKFVVFVVWIVVVFGFSLFFFGLLLFFELLLLLFGLLFFGFWLLLVGLLFVMFCRCFRLGRCVADCFEFRLRGCCVG